MTDIEEVYSKLKNIKNTTPVLLIGERAIYIFKNMYKDNIHYISNMNDVRDLISDLSGVVLDIPIVIEDLSNIYRDSTLLKLIEEAKFPIILLASRDNLSNAIMSRIKTVIKIPDSNYKCNNMNISSAYSELKEKDMSSEEEIKFLAENCPQLLLIQDDIKEMKNKEKIIQIYSRFRTY